MNYRQHILWDIDDHITSPTSPTSIARSSYKWFHKKIRNQMLLLGCPPLVVMSFRKTFTIALLTLKSYKLLKSTDCSESIAINILIHPHSTPSHVIEQNGKFCMENFRLHFAEIWEVVEKIQKILFHIFERSQGFTIIKKVWRMMKCDFIFLLLPEPREESCARCSTITFFLIWNVFWSRLKKLFVNLQHLFLKHYRSSINCQVI